MHHGVVQHSALNFDNHAIDTVVNVTEGLPLIPQSGLNIIALHCDHIIQVFKLLLASLENALLHQLP